MNNDIDKILTDLTNPALLNDPNWLSEAAIKLSAFNYTVNVDRAQAGLAEAASIVKFIDTPKEDGKKMSVAEAQERATVDTNNGSDAYRYQSDALIEVINSIKKRLDVLGAERRNS